MPATKQREILFVFHGKNQSKRSQELQDARRRAHAARQSARKNREPAEATSSPSSSCDSRSVVENGCPDATAQRGPVRRYPVLPPFDSILEEDDSGQLRSRTISPLSILPQDMTDPFRTTVVGQLPSVLQRYLHDGEYPPIRDVRDTDRVAQTMIWPSLVPLVPREQATYFYRRSPIDTPAEIDHQIDAAAAITLQYVRPKDAATINEIIAIGKKHRQISIDWVNDQIANACGPPESKVIAALLSLISHSGLKKPSLQFKYPTSPLIMAEFASLFGSSRVLTEDMLFLHSVVELKGGDDWVGSNVIDHDLPLRLMLNHFDIFIASRKGTQPMWKTIAAVPADIMRLYDAPRGNFGTASTCNGHGFRMIKNPGLRDAVNMARMTINALESYRCESPGAPSYSLVVHMRMFAQHQLLMLYPGADEPPQLRGFDVMIHSAVLLFTDLVLFVLSPTSGARGRLLKDLRTELEHIPWSACHTDEETFLRLWALVMLGIGSITRDVVDEYAISELNHQPMLLVARETWTCIETLMKSFLWWNHAVLTKPAYDVWQEAVSSRERSDARKGGYD